MMNLASYIDHTNLRPNLCKEDVKKLAEEAITHQFVAVCIPPFWVEYAKGLVKGAEVKVCTVAGFPFGYESSFALMASISDSLKAGASEIDLVMNLSAFKSKLYDNVKKDLEVCANIVHSAEGLLKVIIETSYLNQEEVTTACELCQEAQVDFVKTSTGYAPMGAELSKVEWMKATLNEHTKIKASGGIKTYEQALAFIKAGASRIGTSSGVQLIEQNHKA